MCVYSILYSTVQYSTVENCNEIQFRTRAILTNMRLISRPKSIRQRVREGLIRWVKVRIEEQKQQQRVDALRESRGEAPSASTRHSSTTFKPTPKIFNCKEMKRDNKGQRDANAHEDREENSSN